MMAIFKILGRGFANDAMIDLTELESDEVQTELQKVSQQSENGGMRRSARKRNPVLRLENEIDLQPVSKRRQKSTSAQKLSIPTNISLPEIKPVATVKKVIDLDEFLDQMNAHVAAATTKPTSSTLQTAHADGNGKPVVDLTGTTPVKSPATMTTPTSSNLLYCFPFYDRFSHATTTKSHANYR